MIDVKARKVRILVVGDLIIDHYLWVYAIGFLRRRPYRSQILSVKLVSWVGECGQ